MLEIKKYTEFFVANWKMNGSINFIDNFLSKLVLNDINLENTCNIICPPSPYIQYVSKRLEGFYIGGQDCSIFEDGAYTGDVSASMLTDMNCNFCIVGHSERRKNFYETNEDVLKKASNCLQHGINPIICIGETLEQKKKNLTKEILSRQILESIPKNSNDNNSIIAYEPVWAIGTGLTPKLEEISEIHHFIKNEISGFKKFKVIYGGSVKSSNSRNILKLENVDGILIGGASLDVEDLNNILLCQ